MGHERDRWVAVHQVAARRAKRPPPLRYRNRRNPRARPGRAGATPFMRRRSSELMMASSKAWAFRLRALQTLWATKRNFARAVLAVRLTAGKRLEGVDAGGRIGRAARSCSGRISEHRRTPTSSAASRGAEIVPDEDVRLRDGRQSCAPYDRRTTGACRGRAREVAAGGFLWMLALEPDVDPARVPEAARATIRRHRQRDRDRLDRVADQPSPSR